MSILLGILIIVGFFGYIIGLSIHFGTKPKKEIPYTVLTIEK